jgi:hypothetical protein
MEIKCHQTWSKLLENEKQLENEEIQELNRGFPY